MTKVDGRLSRGRGSGSSGSSSGSSCMEGGCGSGGGGGWGSLSAAVAVHRWWGRGHREGWRGLSCGVGGTRGRKAGDITTRDTIPNL